MKLKQMVIILVSLLVLGGPLTSQGLVQSTVTEHETSLLKALELQAPSHTQGQAHSNHILAPTLRVNPGRLGYGSRVLPMRRMRRRASTESRFWPNPAVHRMPWRPTGSMFFRVRGHAF